MKISRTGRSIVVEIEDSDAKAEVDIIYFAIEFLVKNKEKGIALINAVKAYFHYD